VKDRREFLRFPLRLNTRYSVENKEDWVRQCLVVDMSRKGMGLVIYLKDKLPLGCLLKFMVDVPKREEPIRFAGILVWIKELKDHLEYNFKGGIRLTTIDSEDKWALLDYAYEAWKENQEAGEGKEEPSK
jgi:hypothetical protein